MATITKQQLRDLALTKLQVLPSGVAASGEDASIVDGLIDAMFEAYDDVFVFTSAAIPLWAREPLVDMVAARSSPYFGNAPISKTEDMALGDYVTVKRRRINPEQRDEPPEYY